MCLDSNLTMVLYKTFTYLLTYLLTYYVLQFPPANVDTLAIRSACLLNPHERPPKHCK